MLTIIDVLKQQIKLGRAKTTRLLTKGIDELNNGTVFVDSGIDITKIIEDYDKIYNNNRD